MKTMDMRISEITAVALVCCSFSFTSTTILAFSPARPLSNLYQPPQPQQQRRTCLVSQASAVTASDGGSQRNTESFSSFTELADKINGSTPSVVVSAEAAVPSQTGNSKNRHQQRHLDTLFRAQAGPLSFKTKYGVLNPFAIWYGTVAILLGLPWFVALALYQVFAWVTRGKIDPNRLIPNYLNQIWGTLLMRFTRSYPKIEGLDILKAFYKERRPAMFVANHNSWMDIPFLGTTIGWRNYKIISKQELGRVPILGKAIKVGGHIMVDRKDKKSGLRALKAGIQYLKSGIHLCTFPEGTRSRTGRLMPLKHGAFKMAHKAGAPVIALSIVGAHIAHPVWGMFPIKPSHGICKIVVHPPVESAGKTEDELVEAVRQQLIAGLPDDQKPKSLSSKNEDSDKEE